MKKILAIGFALFSVGMFAQSVVIPMTHNGDTATASTSKHVDYTVNKNYSSVSIQSVITKISGTVAGYSVLKGSVDGTNFVDISVDSLLNTDVTTNTKIWIVDGAPYQYYRVTTVGTGTMSVKVYGYLFANSAGQNASTANMLSTTYTANVIDTVTNSATNSVTLRVKGGYNTLAIQPVVTKISGTVAGTVTLQGSNDGTNYVTANTSYISGSSATLTALNQTTTTRLFLLTKGTIYAYYRLSYTGTGTMSAKLRGYLLGR